MRDGTVRLLSRLHTGLYRVTGGRLGRRLPRIGAPMLLLTTTGRRSGEPHTVPLLYLEHGGGHAVIASYGGRPHHPAWYVNLQAEPSATVQVDGRRIAVSARDTTADEREELWSRAVLAYPGYSDYQARTERVIPVVKLEPIA